ncbi:unnamed protein product [Clonostachys rosea]|uniref:DUF7779 domain-containing protein n=1 Tax=Bionectria ochroleuca TaxID=29856 RepID=A0ABY6USG2_BIOOC|nr:unnamed protein product [Clonostachys rosea]
MSVIFCKPLTLDQRAPVLSSTARSVLNLLYFFNPDCIQRSLLTAPPAQYENPAFSFLRNKEELDEAIAELAQLSVIDTDDDGNIELSCDSPFMKCQENQINVAFTHAVRILDRSLPDVWAEGSPGLNCHSLRAGELVVPHVIRIVDVTNRSKVPSKRRMEWLELVLRAGRYSLESQQPDLSLHFVEYILQEHRVPIFGARMVPDIQSRTYTLHAQALLDLARPRAAVAVLKALLQGQQALRGPGSTSVAAVYDSLAFAHLELDDQAAASAYLDKADVIYINQGYLHYKIPRTRPIHALLHLRAGRFDDAVSSLERFWKEREMKIEDVKNEKDANYGGEIMLMARLLWGQGEFEKAQELASQSITMRRTFYGPLGGPRVAESLFFTAFILMERGFPDLTLTILGDLIDMGQGGNPALYPHIARAYWMLAKVEEGLGKDAAYVSELRANARQIRRLIPGDEKSMKDNDDAFRNLVNWVLL